MPPRPARAAPRAAWPRTSRRVCFWLTWPPPRPARRPGSPAPRCRRRRCGRRGPPRGPCSSRPGSNTSSATTAEELPLGVVDLDPRPGLLADDHSPRGVEGQVGRVAAPGEARGVLAVEAAEVSEERPVRGVALDPVHPRVGDVDDTLRRRSRSRPHRWGCGSRPCGAGRRCRSRRRPPGRSAGSTGRWRRRGTRPRRRSRWRSPGRAVRGRARSWRACPPRSKTSTCSRSPTHTRPSPSTATHSPGRSVAHCRARAPAASKTLTAESPTA